MSSRAPDGRWTTAAARSLRDRYIAHLREEIEQPGRYAVLRIAGPRGGMKAVMPGIRRAARRPAAARRRVPRVADRELRGRRADQARALRPVALLPLRRVRRRRRGSQCARAVRARAAPAACGLPGHRRRNISSSSATRRTTSPARALSGRLPSASRPAASASTQLRASGAEIVFKDLSDDPELRSCESQFDG